MTDKEIPYFDRISKIAYQKKKNKKTGKQKGFVKIFLNQKLKLILLGSAQKWILIVLQKWTAMINQWLCVVTLHFIFSQDDILHCSEI